MPEVFDEQDAKRWGRAYESYLRGWLPEKKDASILDVACGGGRLLYFFKSRRYVNVKGIDISEEQINLAKQVVDDVVVGDALEFLASNRERYDLITGLDIIEHFTRDEIFRFLDACYSALRKNGRLILQTPNAESPFGFHHRYHDITHEQAFDSDMLKSLLSLTGFCGTEHREAGPVVHGFVSLIRYIIWRMIRAGLILWNLAETGSRGSGVYTRIFFISGVKR